MMQNNGKEMPYEDGESILTDVLPQLDVYIFETQENIQPGSK